MTHSDPVVTPDSGVPEVAQEFDALVAEHRARLEAEHGVKAEPEPEQDWYFTFGHGQYHRVTGEHLLGAYVVIHGTYLGARQVMVSAFGTAWCDQYGTAESAGVDEFQLRRIELPAIISRDKDGFTVVDRERLDAFHAELDAARKPVTPAEERTGEEPFFLTGDQLCALRDLLALVHYDDLADSWLKLLPTEFHPEARSGWDGAS